MSADYTVQIIDDAFTNGSGLRVCNSDGTTKRFLTPIRCGRILFATPLDTGTILIAAETSMLCRTAFLAIIDVDSGNILLQSASFETWHQERYLVSRDRKAVFSSESFGVAFHCWDIENLALKASPNLIIEQVSDISFDDTGRYFTIENGENGRARRFHSTELEARFTEDINSGRLAFLYHVGPPVGETHDGQFLVPIGKTVRVPAPENPLGWRSKTEDDGFLLIDPRTILARRTKERMPLVQRMEEAAHEAVRDDGEFAQFALKAATLTVEAKEWSAKGLAPALIQVAQAIRGGIDGLRFGNSLNIEVRVGARVYDERSIGEQVFFRTKELRVALGCIIREYNRSVDRSLFKNQIYCGREDEGLPALSPLISAYLKQVPRSLEPVRKYVSRLDQEHCDDRFLRIGSTYFGLTEPQLRVLVCSQVLMWKHFGWNDFSALDVAARHHTPQRLFGIFEDELSRWQALHARLGWASRRLQKQLQDKRNNLKSALRDEFDRELRELIEAS